MEGIVFKWNELQTTKILIKKEMHVRQKKGFGVFNHGNLRNELMKGIESWSLLQSPKAIKTQDAKHQILFNKSFSSKIKFVQWMKVMRH